MSAIQSKYDISAHSYNIDIICASKKNYAHMVNATLQSMNQGVWWLWAVYIQIGIVVKFTNQNLIEVNQNQA